MYKRINRIGIALSMSILMMSTAVFAADTAIQEIKFSIGKPQYTIGDTTRDMEAAPYIKEGRTMLPVAYVAEASGLKPDDIQWNGAARTVTLFKGNSIVQMTIGSREMKKDGRTIIMDATPEIVNGRTMLPIKYIADALGVDIQWNAETKMVTITTEKKAEENESKVEVAATQWDYNFDQLLEKAIKSSKDIKKLEMLVEKAEKLKDSAESSFTMTGSIPGGVSTGKSEDSKDQRQKTYRNYQSQEFAYAKAEKDLETKKDAIANSLRSAYYGVLKGIESKELAAVTLDVQKQTRKQMELKYDQGMISQFEKNKADMNYNEAEKSLAIAEKSLNTAYEKLNYLTGLSPEDRYMLESQLSFDELAEVDSDLDSHIPTMINKSPEIWALQEQLRLAQLNLDLFDFKSDGSYEAKKIDIRTTQIDLANLKQNYESNLRSLHTSLNVLKEQYESAKISYEKALDDLKLAKAQEAAGLGIALDVKKADQQVLQLKNKLDQAIMDYNEKLTIYKKPWLSSSM